MDTAWQRFTIESMRLQDGILLALSGELDLASVSAVDAELRRAEQAHGLIVVDLARVTFMDASGLAALIAADLRLRERHGCLAVVRASRQVARLFELTGAAGQLTMAEDIDDTIDLFAEDVPSRRAA